MKMEKDLKRLRIKRSHLKGAITRMENFVNDEVALAASGADMLQARMDRLKDIYEQYEELNIDIATCDDADNEDTSLLEEKYYMLLSMFQKAIKLTIKNNETQSDTSNSKLPSIEISSYDGKDFTQFKPFMDLFSALIDSNKSLTNVQKMFYLRKYLKGDALSLIINLPIVNESYPEAIKLLVKRYDNRNRIISNHIMCLLDLPPMQKGTSVAIRSFLSVVQQQLHALDNLKQPVDSWDMLLIAILSRKLDDYTKRAYHLDRKDPDCLPTMNEFLVFLEKRAIALEDSPSIKNISYESKSKVSHVVTAKQNICPYCKSNHYIFRCPKFKMASIDDRKQFINTHKLCNLCLKAHTEKCKYHFKCKICKEAHNTLLHDDLIQDQVATLHTNNCFMNNVLLPTIKIKVTDKNGSYIFARALLDSGSQASFVTKALINKLSILPCKRATNIIGIGNKCSKLSQVVTIPIASCQYENAKFEVKCHVVDSITAPLPQQYFDISKFSIPTNIHLADSQFNVPSDISVLLGADIYFNSLLNGYLKIFNGPVLQNTVFGYVVAGEINLYKTNICSNAVTNLAISDNVKLENIMENFWLTEKLPETVSKISDEFQKAEIVFQRSVRLIQNKFYVDLPLICPKEELQIGDSFSVALQRFISLERKFNRDPLLLEQYKKFIEDYVVLGHAKEVNIEKYDMCNDPVYFLAHHAVFNEESKTTKLRVVFDGSMKSKSKVSLNNVMLNGPVVQSELFDIILLFRTYLFTLICDIEKMFRCCFINDHHKSLQNILWRDDPGKPMICLQLQTITYGLKASTFLATRCLVELAHRYKDQYPLAAQALLVNTYIDDILTGVDDENKLFKLKNELIELLKMGNFSLHKWCSNHLSVLNNISKQQKLFDSLDLNKMNVIKALGLKYNVRLDTFFFETPKCNENLNTKRKVLSYIGKIFDPLGIIGPIVVVAKMFMQELWSTKLEWDDVLPATYLKQWEKFLYNLKLMNKISVPRFIQSTNFSKIHLIGYADASLKAYGCCLYVRVQASDDNISVNLLCSKSRVAPLSRTLTIPLLELNSALLLAQLVNRVSKILTTRFPHSIQLHSDSQIVLAWIQSNKIRANTYVNNRVQQIVDLTKISSWSYTRSEDNPADLLSRGIEPQKLQSNKLWWHGPSYLLNSNISQVNVYDSQKAPNVKFHEEIPCVIQNLSQSQDFNLFEQYSKISKLQAVIAYMYRFYNNSLHKHFIKDYFLTPKELENALYVIIRYTQKQHLSQELYLIMNNKKVKSGLGNLHPYVDALGVLRVGGRLLNADIPQDKMHPMILPKNSKITSMIIENEHLRLLHAGPRLVLSTLSQKYWVINGIREVKKALYKCIKCARLKAETASQLMGSLPVERVTASRPFQHVGIDFCGPFSIKVSRIRKPLVTKGYVALFVCFSTKAIHAEVVSDLTTDTFLACFNRFISRRGMPTKVFCDNAKTFKGAENKLKELYNLQNSKSHRDSVYNYCREKYIKFMFIPSYSPEFGGLWEAGVKSVKHHLKRVVGNLCLTYEEFNTVIIQIEGVLNSRPLLSNPSCETAYLTPGHFLIGTALCSYPEINILELPTHRLKFWKLVTKIKQHFWQRWSKDYLVQLQSRPKWKKCCPNLKEGDLVFVKNINTPPLEWPLAKIVKVFPGKDNNVRVAELNYNNKTYLRSIATLCPLPIN